MSTSQSLSEALLAEGEHFLLLTSEQLGALDRHYHLLCRWNQKMNLTTVTGLPAAATRHYGESLFLARYLTSGRVVDVGSGAGFPGIPVAVARPDCLVTLVESNQRKAVFLREATRGLPNVDVIAARAERSGPASNYDWLISRAVYPAQLAKLRIAKRFAVLLGSDDTAQLRPEAVIPLPWGDRRMLAVGACFTWNDE